MEGLIALGFMNPPSDSVEEYVAHLENELVTRFGARMEGGGDLVNRAEAVIRALADLGQLDVFED